MFKKVQKVSLAKYLTNVVWEMVVGDKHGNLLFPVLPGTKPIWTTPESGEIETEILYSQFRLEWAYNPGAKVTRFVLSNPHGKTIKGGFTVEALLSMPFEAIAIEIVRDILEAAEKEGWLTEATYNEQELVEQAIYNQMTFCLKKMSKAVIAATYPAPTKPNVVNYSNSGHKLARVIPGMLFEVPETTCPGDLKPFRCNLNPKSHGFTFEKLVIHLNDHHKWPRSANDKPPKRSPNWDMSINIADWSEQYALLHNLDMNFRTPEEMEELKQKEKNKKKGAKAAFLIEDEYSPYIEQQLYQALKLYGLEEKASGLLTPKDLKGNPLVKKEDSLSSMTEESWFQDSDSKNLKKLSSEWMKKYDQFISGPWGDALSGGAD